MIDLKTVDIKRTLKNTLLVILGTVILAFGVGIFIVPFDLVTGGLTGLCIVLKQALSGIPFFAELEISVYVAVINWVFFFLGLVFLGRSFAAKPSFQPWFIPLLFRSAYTSPREQPSAAFST